MRGSPARVFAELEAMGTPEDRIWPAPTMPFRRDAGPLREGRTIETHGIIRAVLGEYRHGEAIRWDAELPFLVGTHGFRVRRDRDGAHVEHVLDAKLTWWFWPVWVARVGAVHDRILERLFDRLERAVA